MTVFFSFSGAYGIAFLNLPFDCPLGDTTSNAIISSNEHLAILASFLLGTGDAILNTQIYALNGTLFSDRSAHAFAIFKFLQSGLAAVGFFYSSKVELQWQLLFLVSFSIIGSISFVIVNRISQKRTKGHAFEKVNNPENK